MNGKEHKAAIEAAIEAALEDGYQLDVSNSCAGCCSSFEATLCKSTWNGSEWVDSDHQEIDL